MHKAFRFDATDRGILRALIRSPRATTSALADLTRLSRNTVQARMTRWSDTDALRGFDRRIDPESLGFPIAAYVFTEVTQRRLAEVAAALTQIPEVIEVHGLTGATDLLIHVVARDADDLYRIAGRILDVDGVQRSTTALKMRTLVDFRIEQLLE
ncbi:Lrp/AsnC family transcriptional regulator [Gordonia sp. ABSL49_1]|uniref:Lrp/AsnC family transcriptional regulator n=1 Tax=Gordonia sp. NPDC003585 TaxID=3154275 RepID=UPI001F0D7D48|nr:Lrp/AsnC family transcriptional regulator [Gordonia sp. ABSL49_1]MCH5645355.1 Lrp/AsnC family transcriptional regulator [Gordonia sp. ABSL49_1]